MKGLGQGCMENVPPPQSSVAGGFQQFGQQCVDGCCLGVHKFFKNLGATLKF